MADSGERSPEMVERRSGKEAAERPEGWTTETTKTKMKTESGIEEEDVVFSSPRRSKFHRLNIKNDSRLEGLIKTPDLVSSSLSFLTAPTPPRTIGPLPCSSHWPTINLATIWTPAEYNAGLLDTIYNNFIDALPVVKYCSENNRRLIHFSTCDLRGVGKTIGSFLLKDHPLATGFLRIWLEETIHR